MGEPSDGAARVLRRAEDRLRAVGLTGARAFEVLVDALQARLGEARDVDPVAADALADLPTGADVDLLGLAYERFFPELFKGKRGQYFTPRPLVRLLLSRIEVGIGTRVLDPTCGSGGLLVEAARRGAAVRGIERDPLLARLAGVNLGLAGVRARVRCADFFAAEPEPVEVVVANPPFSVEIRDPEVLARYEVAAGRDRALSDHLFVEALERWVLPGGQAALVLPWSLVVNPSAEALRARIDAAWVREAVCALPEGVFRPFGGAAGRACLLWLRRRPAAEAPQRWAELRDPGYDVRSAKVKRTSDAEVARLLRGEGFESLPEGAWTPAPPELRGKRVGDLARLREEKVVPSRDLDGPIGLVELADTDKGTGEVTGVREVGAAEVTGVKAVLGQGDVLVSRMRPELGNVAVRPPFAGPVVGSTEWLPLVPARHGHWLLHALRAPAWREALPITEGQTRPRTTGDAVLDSVAAWPGEAVAARVDALSRRLYAERARLREQLLALQAAVDAFAAGEIDAEALAEAVAALETARDG